MRGRWQKIKKTRALPYILSALISLIIVLVVLRVFNLNLSIPLNFSNDSLVHYNFAKNIQDTGWWLTNNKLGAPGIQTLYDFPLTETFNLLIIKFLILLGLNWYQSVNIFFVLTFPLAAVISMYVMVRLGIKTIITLPLSIIYAFTPYHLYRGVNHLFLAAYFTVPLGILAAYLVAMNKPPRGVRMVILAAVIAFSGPYYTFFSCFLILAGLIISLAKSLDKKLILSTAVLLSFIVGLFFLNLLPSIIHSQRYGNNLNALIRSPSETELYGLKITQLLLPIEDHNFGLFNKIYKHYATYGYSSTVNENQYSSLGAVASLGFLLLLFWTVFKPKFIKLRKDVTETANVLGVFNLASILLATTGGLSLLFSLFLSPTFRSVNRISIFIAFLSLAAVGLLLQNARNRRLVLVAVWALLPIALFDQISVGVMRNFPKNQSQFYQYLDYAKQIERIAGEGAKVFTLPFGQYPEGRDKLMLQVALLTDSIVWSAGAETWRSASYWQYKTAQLPVKKLLISVIDEEFTGILVYSPDFDRVTLMELERELQKTPDVNEYQGFRYYDLRKYISNNKIAASPSEILYHVSGNCRNDYNDNSGKITGYWCVDKARIVLENRTDKELGKRLVIQAEFPKTGKKILNVEVKIPTSGTIIEIPKEARNDGVFPVPHDRLVWPPTLGYPNLIIRDIRILE